MPEALEYLVPERFDIAAKTLYARFREDALESDWGRWVYAHHLKVWNGFHESEPVKDGFDAYQQAFDNILDEMKEGRFDFSRDPIVINQHGVPVNAAHRLAAALIYGRSIPGQAVVVKKTKARDRNFPYDYLFFKNRTKIVPTGLATVAADAMALEYCRLRAQKRDLYIVTVFPSAQGKEEEIQRILAPHGRIVYRKNVGLTKNGSIHLIYHVYMREPWVGSAANGFKGAQRKAQNCFSHDGPLRVYLLQAQQLDQMVAAKKQIRDLFLIKNDSVHINDSFEETMLLGRLLFNENSIHFLNVAAPHASFKKFWSLLQECARSVKELGIDADDLCIGGSAPMAAFGLRDVNDFDYVHGRRFNHKKLGENITSHEGWTHYYHVTTDDIVYNPSNHFWYHGLKFATLDIVREMKTKRWEKKDKRDVAMINDFENSMRRYQARPPSLPIPAWFTEQWRRLRRSLRYR